MAIPAAAVLPARPPAAEEEADVSARRYWPIVTTLTDRRVDVESLTVPVRALRYRRGRDCTRIHRWLGQNTGPDDFMCGGGADIAGESQWPDIPLGHWIVRDPLGGQYSVLSDADFKARFSTAPPEKRP